MAKLKLDIKQNGEIIKTYEADTFELKYGVIDDFFAIYEAFDDKHMRKAISKRHIIPQLIKDIFLGITDEEIRELNIFQIITELAPDLIAFTGDELGKIVARASR